MNPIVKSHVTPEEISLDVFSILLNNEISFSVEGVNEHERTIIIRSETSQASGRHKKALDNIQGMLSEYRDYRYGSDSGQDVK